MTRLGQFLPLLTFLVATVAIGQDQKPELPDAPPPEPLPPKELNSEARLEPAVTITRGDDGRIIEEYRQPNGQIYMVKITPTDAPAYFIYDHDGDGRFESDIESDPGLVPVYWKLYEWR